MHASTNASQTLGASSAPCVTWLGGHAAQAALLGGHAAQCAPGTEGGEKDTHGSRPAHGRAAAHASRSVPHATSAHVWAAHVWAAHVRASHPRPHAHASVMSTPTSTRVCRRRPARVMLASQSHLARLSQLASRSLALLSPCLPPSSVQESRAGTGEAAGSRDRGRPLSGLG